MLLKLVYEICMNCGKTVHKGPGYCLLCGCSFPQRVPVDVEGVEDTPAHRMPAAA